MAAPSRTQVKAKKSRRKNTKVEPSAVLVFDDNRLLAELFGRHDAHLARIEQLTKVHLFPKGNEVAISGDKADCAIAETALRSLYQRLRAGLVVTAPEVEAAVRLAVAGTAPLAGMSGGGGAALITVHTRKRVITPRSAGQAEYLAKLQTNDLVFCMGPAGTGKTYLAVAVAVSMLLEGAVDRIILSRPAVEAGERLGFLPGDIREKVDPYLRPLYDALSDMLSWEQVMRRLETGDIEIAPLAFMRGRTLSNAFVILDEAQNTSSVQMKMFITRFGENSRMVITGDPSQVDLPPGQESGLDNAAGILRKVDGIAFVRLTETDVVRHNLVRKVVVAYDKK